MQITSSPAIIALSVNKDNYTHSCIVKNKKFAVSILSEESNPLAIGTFGFRSGRDCDKFSIIPHEFYDELPVVKDACGYLICEIYDSVDTPSHTVFFAKVLNGDLLNSGKPMTYYYYHNVIKGNSPKAAPSYIE